MNDGLMELNTAAKESPRPSLGLNSVLIVRMSSLGDVVCTLPVAGFIRRAFPSAKVSWAVDPRFAPIVECCSHVHEVIATKVSPLSQSRRAVHRPFDAVVEMQGLAKSAWLALSAQSKVKLGYHWQREGAWLVSEKVLPDPTSLHVVDQYVDVARELVHRFGGVEVDSNDNLFGLKPTQKDLESVKSKLQECGVTGPFAVLNPGGAWATKQWKPESFAQVAKRLEAKGFQSVTIGSKSPSELAALEILKGEAKQIGTSPVSMLGQTSIGELIALISLGQLHLGGDTGSTHIAAALGIPAIGLYSITKPERSCPYRQRSHCLYHPKRLDYITVDEVLDKINEVLG